MFSRISSSDRSLRNFTEYDVIDGGRRGCTSKFPIVTRGSKKGGLRKDMKPVKILSSTPEINVKFAKPSPEICPLSPPPFGPNERNMKKYDP